MQAEIKEGYKVIGELRELFIKRMTVDGETHDRRRSDYNEAIFDEHYKPKPDVSLGSVLKCFNNAVKDWRKTFCDNDKCRERKVPKEIEK